ncbi:MAG: hypothetical protein VKQ33_16335, partial [Candidatus Sericytochromatia bacterium]|nr:hypothetical protein [Candidatus Sericytochromatia bacterium]
MFKSDLKHLGTVQLPAFSGTRIMMMPFLLEDGSSIPADLFPWREFVGQLTKKAGAPEQGVAYLTIDEALIQAGETQRRPGLHVDGIGPDGREGGWGGGGGWGTNGMIVAASVACCNVFAGDFQGYPGPNGDCAHLADECDSKQAVLLEANQAYWLGPMTVHEVFPMKETVKRQFVRISMPSNAPWYEGYT